MLKRMRACGAVAIAACLCACLLAFAGCSAPAGTGLSEGAQDAAATKTVVDAYGRSVEVPADVQSAATVGSGARFVVYAGGQDKLIAATEMETEPALNRPYTIAYKGLFANLPATSNGNHLLETNVNEEQLMELAPDVIISSRSAEECDSLQADTGIPVIGITYQNQLFTDNVYTSITCVGEALGTQVKVQYKGGKGSLQVYFNSDEQLRRFANLLGNEQ